jgi:hypothetical protein
MATSFGHKRAFSSRWRGAPHVDLVLPDFDFGVGVRFEILEPQRMVRHAALRGHHHIVVAFAQIEQRRGAWLAGFSALGSEQEDGRAAQELRPEAAAAHAEHCRVRGRHPFHEHAADALFGLGERAGLFGHVGPPLVGKKF